MANGHSHAIAATAGDDCRSAIRRLIDAGQETQTLCSMLIRHAGVETQARFHAAYSWRLFM